MLDRKKDFICKIKESLKGILYQKKRVVYSSFSDTFTMFIYFGKHNNCTFEYLFTLKSNYYFGLMNEDEINQYCKNCIEFNLLECKMLSNSMILDLEQKYGSNYSKYIKLHSF